MVSLATFDINVALDLQTAFVSPPVAMPALYLKGVVPPHVTLGQIFRGIIPFMLIQILAIVLLYLFTAMACGFRACSTNRAKPR